MHPYYNIYNKKEKKKEIYKQYSQQTLVKYFII